MEEKSMEFSNMAETKSDFMTSDFDHSGIDQQAVKADLNFIRDLVDERDREMLERDQGGFQLGNSRTVLSHVQQATQRIRAMIDTQSGDRGLYKDNGLTEQQRRELRGEAKAIIGRALMEARAEFIRRSGKPLNGY